MLAGAREMKGDVTTVNPLHDELSQWSVEELRAALQAAVSQPAFFLANNKVSALTRHLINEWMSRDLDSFLAWYDGLKSEKARSSMAMTMSFLWPQERAEDGVRYILSHPEFKSVNGGSGSWKIVKSALENSAQRGPQAAAECLAMIQQNGLYLDESPLMFPAGFDFATLMKTREAQELWKAGKATGLLYAWLKQDRDAAFDAITANAAENQGGKSMSLFSQEMGVTQEAFVERVSWLGKRISELEPEQREAMITEGFDRITYSADAIKALADGLTDPADQRLVHGRAVEAIRTIGVQAAFAHLEEMGTPRDRIDFLTNFTPAAPWHGSAPEPIPEDLVRSKLAEWKATPEETESILKRLNAK